MKKNNTKVLILGSGGMLGQELENIFKKDESFEVTSWDKVDVDVTDEKKLRDKIFELKPNTIINAIAYNAVDKVEENTEEFKLAKKLNEKVPENLAKISNELKAVLVHFSTDYVFDGKPEIPEPTGCTHTCSSCSLHENFQPEIGFDEDSEPNPINKYGKTKLEGEKNIQKNTKEFYLIRLSKLFGNPGKSIDTKKSFFDVMIEIGKNNKVVKIVDEETSCFTYAPDLAKKTKEIIESKKPFGIYHITNSDSCTWYEAVLELYNQAGIKAKIEPVLASEFSRSAKRPFYSVLLNTKLNPLRSYKDALKEYLKSKKKNNEE